MNSQNSLNLFEGKIFTDSNGKKVEYDGSPISWRPSVYGIVIHDNQMLLIKNAFEEMHDIPGGGVETHESFADALAREGREEAGAEIQIQELVHVNEGFFFHITEKKFFHSIQLFFTAQLSPTQGKELSKPSDPDITGNFFVPIHDLSKYPLSPAVLTAIRKTIS